MKNFIISSFLILLSLTGKSQCFQIESILVDACDGPNEGQNEMVTFKVGSANLSAPTLTVNWPANTWIRSFNCCLK